MKKPVVKKETIASLKAELWEVQTKYNKLADESAGLKRSFDMVKANYEREKTRLDKTIDSLLNITKKQKKWK